MKLLSKINICLAFIVFFLFGIVVGQSVSLGWGLPLGTSLTLLVAVSGFGVAIYQSYAARKHNRLLVKPHLVFDSTFSSTTKEGFYTYALKVKNVGLGPAIITNYSISLGDKVELDGYTVFDALVRCSNVYFKANGSAICNAGFLYPENALEKSEEKILLEISFPVKDASFMQARELSKGFVNEVGAKIGYSCHYGNEFYVAKGASSQVSR